MFRIICLLIGYAFGMIQTSYIVGKMSGIDIREHGSKNAGFTNTNRVLGIKKGVVVFVVDVVKAMLAFAAATFIYNNFIVQEHISFFICQEWENCLNYGTYDPFSILRTAPACSPISGFFFAGGTFFVSSYVLPGLYAGLGAILGHCFPFYLNFKGGKGVACALGVIIMLDWRVAIISFATGLIVVLITRFISLASLLITLSVPFLMFLFEYGPMSEWPIYVSDWAYFAVRSEVLWLTVILCVFIWYLHRENIKRLLSGTENKFSFKKT